MKKPYQPPEIVRLGNVEELTKGGAVPTCDNPCGTATNDFTS